MTASKRDKELAKQRVERQEARRAAVAARRKQRNAVVASVLAVLLVAGGLAVLAANLGDGDEAPVASSPLSASPAPTGTAAPDGCAYEETGSPARQVELPPTEGVETDGVFTATMATSIGPIVFEMDAAAAPCTVNSLRSLAHFSYFDDTVCHRLTTQGIFVLQCGDPSGDGTGGPGYRFEDENLEGATYPRGTVAMANSGPGTNGSQFFLVYQDSQLPPDYTPFGRITTGLEAIDAVAEAGSTPAGDGKPKTAVTVTSLRTAAKA